MSSRAFRKFWMEGPGSFLIAIAAALFVRWALFEAYVIPSGSMLPTLLHHDHIFVNKMLYGLRMPFSEKWFMHWGDPERGEVVVFKYPQDKKLFYIKRIIGLPGDRILYENEHLYVNETLVDRTVPTTTRDDWNWLTDRDFPAEGESGGKDNYVQWQETLDGHPYSILLRKNGGPSPTFGPFVVPEGHFFVLGDNRDNSLDSRAWDAQAKFATGELLISRNTTGGAPISIAKGTVFKTSQSQALAVQFEAVDDVTMNGNEARIPIRCKEAGAQGNVPPGAIQVMPESLAGKDLQINNLTATSGGEDKRFVPRDYLVGRASFVWLSCEDTLPMVNFLCHPLKIRWNRFFHIIR